MSACAYNAAALEDAISVDVPKADEQEDFFEFAQTFTGNDAWASLGKIAAQFAGAMNNRKTVSFTFSVSDSDGLMEVLEVCEFRHEHDNAVLGVTKFDLCGDGADD